MSRSLQDIIRQRQQEVFVGRGIEVDYFRRNILLPAEDENRRFVLAISGQGGIGKTWLLRRWRHIANGEGANTAISDETQGSIAAILGAFGQEIKNKGQDLSKFNERYRVYRQRCQELESDPEMPQGLPAMFGNILVRTGFQLARTIPVGSMVLSLLDEEAIASQASELATYLSRKLNNKDEVQLLLDPVGILTPLFLRDLQDIGDHPTVVLFFDNYEITVDYIDPWIRQILDGRYGELSPNMLFCIAGREELSRSNWSAFEGVVARFPLEPFTDQEAREYLARKGIDNENIVRVIFSVSQKVPLLLATLAANNPKDPTMVDDACTDAVNCILKWIKDPTKRRVVLDASIPRRIDSDIFSVIVGDEQNAIALFDWLKDMHLLVKTEDGWKYHDTVRTQMIHYRRHEAPQGWKTHHHKLAAYYEMQQANLMLNPESAKRNTAWHILAIEVLYHKLCEAPQNFLSEAINRFVEAMQTRLSLAHRWAQAIKQAGEDTQDFELETWGDILVAGLKSYLEDKGPQAITMFDRLLELKGLNNHWHPYLLSKRGYALNRRGDTKKALLDLDSAIASEPDNAKMRFSRGIINIDLGQFDDALADFEEACNLDPLSAQAFAMRSLIIAYQGRHEDALDLLASLPSTLSSNPLNMLVRSLVLIMVGKGEEAVKTIIELNDGITDVNRWMSSDQDHKEEINHFIDEVSPKLMMLQKFLLSGSNFTISMNNGNMHEAATIAREMTTQMKELIQSGFFNEHLFSNILQNQDFIKSVSRFASQFGGNESLIEDKLKLLGQNSSISEKITLIEAMMAPISSHKFVPSLADLDQLISQNTKESNLYVIRANILEEAGRYQEALADLDLASDLDPNVALKTSNSRGLIFTYLGKYSEAIECFRRILEITPDDHIALYNLAVSSTRLNGIEDSKEVIEQARNLLTSIIEGTMRGQALYGLGGLAAIIGDQEIALNYLQEAIVVTNQSRKWARKDVAWLDLRADSRFVNLVNQ